MGLICDCCCLGFKNQKELNNHLKTKEHIELASTQFGSVKDIYSCYMCNISYIRLIDYYNHTHTTDHIFNTEKNAKNIRKIFNENAWIKI